MACGVMLICAALLVGGCGGRKRKAAEEDLSRKPVELDVGAVRPRSDSMGDRMSLDARFDAVSGEDVPLGETQPDMSSYEPPGGSSSGTEASGDGDEVSSAAGDDSMEAVRKRAAELFSEPVHFAFDSYELNAAARERLDAMGEFLLSHPEVSVVVEGHCDERGSDAYNLALGEKRALAVRRYWIAMGVEPSRIHTVSYGEQRPLDPRHNEEAWARNRRAQFRLAFGEVNGGGGA